MYNAHSCITRTPGWAEKYPENLVLVQLDLRTIFPVITDTLRVWRLDADFAPNMT